MRGSVSLTHPPSASARSVPALSPRAALAQAKAWLADRSDSTRAQRSAGTVFLIRIASAAIAYLSQVLLARWMGTFEFGVYVYVWTWVLLIGGLADLGLDTAAQRFIPEYAERKAFAKLRGFLAASRWIALGVSTTIALLGLAGVWLLQPWLNRYEIIPLYLACACVPLYALTGLQDGIARSYNWVNLGLVPPFIVRPLLLIALMMGAYTMGLGSDATVAMGAAIVATWATGLGQFVILRRRLAAVVEPGPKAYDLPVWRRTSLPILAVSCFYLLLTYTDILVLDHYRSPEEVAYYYAAAKTLALVAFVNFSVAAVTGHKFAEYHVAGDGERLRSFLAQAVRWTFWPSLAATVVILALGWPFLWLFGPKFVDGYPLMFILSVGLLARSSVGPAERLLNMLGEQRSCALVYGASFAFNLALCLLLIPRFGAYGAATAIALAFVVEAALLFLVSKYRLGLHAFIWPRRRP
jgi:O-antigen/teichoic acid export membrane protein